jgi:hypothetical protein
MPVTIAMLPTGKLINSHEFHLIHSFRENINAGITPTADSLSIDSVFAQYYFQNDKKEENVDPIQPIFNMAIMRGNDIKHKIDDETEAYFLSIQLGELEIHRKITVTRVLPVILSGKIKFLINGHPLYIPHDLYLIS